MQAQTYSAQSRAKPKQEVIGDAQDRLLREVVRLMEAEQRSQHFTWSWLAEQSELTTSGYYAWRSGKTKGVFLRRINSVLKPMGWRLKLERIK